MKRKYLALLLTGVLALSVTACGNDSSASSSESVQTEEDKDTSEEDEEEKEDEKEAEDTSDAKEEEKEEETDTEEQTDGDPMELALANMEGVTSMDAQMVMYMDMTMEADGQSESVESVTTMDMTCFADPVKLKMEMSMDMGAEGSTEMSIYADVADDGTYMMYMYDGTAWQAMEVGEMDLESYDARKSMISNIDNGSEYVLEGTEQLNGANAYKYSSTMTGDDMKKALLSSGALNSVSSLGISSGDMMSMLDGLGEIVTYVWIDEETLCPVQYEMDMTEVMDALMAAVIESMGEEAEGISIRIPRLEMTMTCSNYNNATDFEIPEEAKNAEAMSMPQTAQ